MARGDYRTYYFKADSESGGIDSYTPSAGRKERITQAGGVGFANIVISGTTYNMNTPRDLPGVLLDDTMTIQPQASTHAFFMTTVEV